jgi:chromosome segregation ATPase
MNLQDKIIEKLTEIDGNVKGIQVDLAITKADVKGMKTKLDSLAVRQDRTDSKLDGLTEIVSKQGKLQDKLIMTVLKTESGVKELLEWKVEMTSKVDGLVDCVEGFAKQHNTMDCEVTALRSKTDRHEGRITRLEHEMKLKTV